MGNKIFSLKNGRLALVFGMVLVFVASFSIPASADIGDRLEVYKSTSMLYAGPSSTASRLVTLQPGEQMVEMDRQSGWVFVALKQSGAQGWVKSSVLRKAMMRKTVTARKKHTVAKYASAKKRSHKKSSRKNEKPKFELKTVPEADVATPETPHVTRQVSLKNMGFTKGILFEGATVKHSRTFFFPAPLDSKVTNATLRLLFRSSPHLHELANMRVSVNDVPYQQVNMPQDGAMHELDILLSSHAFKGGLVKVTVTAVLPVSDDRCFDDRMSDIFLHILPDSSLLLAYQPVDTSIRDAWRMLPHHVTLSISKGSLSREQFASALAVMSLLSDSGREVEITRLPNIGDIVVAPKLSLERMLNENVLRDDAGQVVEGGMGDALDHLSNLSLIRFSNRSSIVLTDPYDVQPMYLLSDSWMSLAASDRYRVFNPDNVHAHSEVSFNQGEKDYYSLPLGKLGLDTGSRFLTREVSWNMVINPFSLPRGTTANFVNLNVVAPVHWEKDPSYELYVFLNGVLVKSVRLANTGLKQHFTVDMPSEYQKQFNNIRVVVQHDIGRGDCRGVMPFDYVQITPDSALVVKRSDTDVPEKFADLSRYFQSGFDTYMDEDFLSKPEHALQLMARMAADVPLVIDHSRLHFVGKGETLNPENPFVAVGRFKLGEGIEAPVRFDKGHVEIVSSGGESYFDVDQLDKVTIAEIVKAPSSYGLWISPSDVADKPISKRLELAEDDVAFIDSQGVIKTLDSSEPSIAQVYYPDVEDWFDVLGKYRFWLMVLLWFLLTMVVVYLYRMTRANKMAREQDDQQYQADEDLMQGERAALHPGDTLDHLDERR